MAQVSQSIAVHGFCKLLSIFEKLLTLILVSQECHILISYVLELSCECDLETFSWWIYNLMKLNAQFIFRQICQVLNPCLNSLQFCIRPLVLEDLGFIEGGLEEVGRWDIWQIDSVIVSWAPVINGKFRYILYLFDTLGDLVFNLSYFGTRKNVKSLSSLSFILNVLLQHEQGVFSAQCGVLTLTDLPLLQESFKTEDEIIVDRDLHALIIDGSHCGEFTYIKI